PVKVLGRLRAGDCAIVALLALTFLCAAQGVGELGYTSKVSERLADNYSQRFRNPQAKARLEAWKRFAAERRGKGLREQELLTAVNQFLNRVPFVEDQKHWGVEDYWATPAEAIASNGADCEDFSVA